MEANKNKLILYIDWQSQPARAVMSLVELNQIPVEVREVSLMGREHLEPEFVKINPLK